MLVKNSKAPETKHRLKRNALPIPLHSMNSRSKNKIHNKQSLQSFTNLD